MPADVQDESSYELDGDHSAMVLSRLPATNIMIKGQKSTYAVGKLIALGKFGGVYQVLQRVDGKRFAAKLEVCDVSSNALNMDYIVLKTANKLRSNSTHFCELVDRGKIEGHFKFLVMKLVGDNLHKLRLQFQECRFSAPTALRLALEMLEALEELHSFGFVHRDVKPSNFAIQEEAGKTNVYLIDFGLCRQFRNSMNGEIKPPREHTQFRGTTRYASLAAHRAEEISPKDDLESWFYVVVELMTGELPWGSHRQDEKDAVKVLKEKARIDDGLVKMLAYCPRVEFCKLLKYLDGLDYNSLPDYNLCRDLIQLAMKNNEISPNEPYDWQQLNVEDSDGQLNGEMANGH
ncbi:protein kinase domain-containing protein [Ditylenchus destructor]|uniref:Protein kinase domain-containing protein n=1 Tax=Ditylenchus destructor TaxID=166010 RepID=A0AAD4QZ70_9BILA|nr:protein kinase domain-containing protein [Ditylenchus destructor]